MLLRLPLLARTFEASVGPAGKWQRQPLVGARVWIVWYEDWRVT